jgi:MoaA/NifB/PqqE/SkfB family radical SAM enzyme
MCDIWKRTEWEEVSLRELARRRDSLLSLGVQHVVFTGGEPLLHRNFAALAAFFRELNIKVTLLTTGLLLHKYAVQVASSVDEIILSLDGPPAVHNAIRRIPNAFEVAAHGIQLIRSLQPAVRIAARTTIQKQNHHRLRETVDTANKLGLNSISFLAADLTSSSFNRDQPWSADRQVEISLTAAELISFEQEIDALISQHARQIHSGFIQENEGKLRHLPDRFREYLFGTPSRSPKCNAPWVSAVLEVDGRLRPCFFHSHVSYAGTSTLEEAINSNAAVAFREKLDVETNPICRRCVCSLNYAGVDSNHSFEPERNDQ